MIRGERRDHFAMEIYDLPTAASARRETMREWATWRFNEDRGWRRGWVGGGGGGGGVVSHH